MFLKKIIAPAIVMLTLISLVSCGDDPASIGDSSLIDQDRIGVIDFDSQIDSFYQASSFSKRIFVLSSSNRIYLGEVSGAKASVLFDYRMIIPDSIKSGLLNGDIKVIDAFFEMKPILTIGESYEPFDFSVHRVRNQWTLYFTSDSVSKLEYDLSDLSSSKVITDSIIHFKMDNAETENLMKWISDNDSQERFYGFYFKPSSICGKILGFQAMAVYETYPLPLFKAVIEKENEYIDTLNFYLNIDVHVVEGDIPHTDEQNIFIQGGLTIDSKIYFDLSKLPRNSIINYAELQLFVDSSKSILEASANHILNVRLLKDSLISAYDSSSYIYLRRADNKFTGNITSYVQRWVNGEENHGLLISLTDNIANVDRYSFYSSKASIEEKRPRLKIKLTKRL